MTEVKLKLELNFVGDGRIFLNYWDSIHANDVIAEFKDNELIHIYDCKQENEMHEKITLQEYISIVEKSYLETIKSE